MLRAGGRDGEGKLAFQDLCTAYWYPLFAFARRKGNSLQDAEDAVQSFLAWLFESGVVERADPERGRFRSFLITIFKHYLARQHHHRTAQRRSPTTPLISIDAAFAEERYACEPADFQTPELQFERAWALTVMERAGSRLQAEWAASGKGERFEALKGCLSESNFQSGRALAAQLNMTEGAVRVAIHRLKSRYSEIMRAEIASTVDSADDIEEELRQLLIAISSS